jgi:hypothetical protein
MALPKPLSSVEKVSRGQNRSRSVEDGSCSKHAQKTQSGSSTEQSQGLQAQSVEELQLTPELCSFLAFLREAKVNLNSQTVLLDNGVDSIEALMALLPGDLESIGLQLGQRRLLDKLVALSVVPEHGSKVAPTATNEPPMSDTLDANVPSKVTKDCKADAEGRLNTNLFLGFGVNGEQSSYYDIVGFLPKRSPYDISPDAKTVIVQREDGSLMVEPTLTREKSIEKVSWQQWVDANTQIMAVLLHKGTDAREYMTYTVMISQLAQRYEWLSILKFDREYRRKQANTGCPWGSDMQILREVTLIPKGQTFNKSKRFGSEQGFTKKKGAGRGKIGTYRQERDKQDSSKIGRASCRERV